MNIYIYIYLYNNTSEWIQHKYLQENKLKDNIKKKTF